MRLNRTATLSALSLALAGGSLTAHAKSIDYSPELTSEQYWASHRIAVVRVENTDGVQMTYRVVEPLSGSPAAAARTIPISSLWFGLHVDAPPPLAAGDRLALFESGRAGTPSAAFKIDGSPLAAATLMELEQISRLRSANDAQSLKLAAAATDPVIAAYSLRQLLQTKAPLTAVEVAGLKSERADETRIPEVRILAARVAAAHSPADEQEEYVWLKSALTNSASGDWLQLRSFVDRLLDFPANRADAAAFLTGQVLNSSGRLAVRIAAYSAFEDDRLFNFRQPDRISDGIFQACTQLLSDSEPELRMAGAALLHNLSVQASAESRPRYLASARRSIAAAIGREADPEIQARLQIFSDRLSQ